MDIRRPKRSRFCLEYRVNSKSYNGQGVSQIKTPAGWVWIWQLLGVLFVMFFNFSPWHLIWWWMLGFIVTIIIGKIILASGYDLLAGQRWK